MESLLAARRYSMQPRVAACPTVLHKECQEVLFRMEKELLEGEAKGESYQVLSCSFSQESILSSPWAQLWFAIYMALSPSPSLCYLVAQKQMTPLSVM